MPRVAPSWLSGYSAVVLLVAVMVNLSNQMSRSAFGLTLPAMESSLKLTHFQAGGLITSMSILGMAANLIFGMLAPRYGSRYLVGVSAIAAGTALVLIGTSTNFLFALAMSAIMGFATGACITPTMGLLAVWFDSRHRGTVAGLAAAGGGAGFVVLGVVVPWLTGRNPDNGWRHTWYFLAGMMFLTAVLSLALLRDRRRPTASDSRSKGAWPLAVYRNPRVWLVVFLAFWAGWTVGSYTTFFGVYLEEQGFSLAASGRLWGLLGTLAVGSGLLWGILSDRIGRPRGFTFSFAVFGLGCLLFWAVPVLAGFIASVVLVGITLRAAYTMCVASAGEYVEAGFSAAAFGLMGVGAGFGQAIGPLISGHIADVTGSLNWVYILATIASAVGMVGSTFLRRPNVTV